VLVEGVDSLAPSELFDHVAPQIDVVVSSGEIAVSLDEGVDSSLGTGMHVSPLDGVVVEVRGDGAEVAEELHILHVVVNPNRGVEGHFAVLHRSRFTISSMALESLLNTSVKILSRSYSWADWAS
jgi:hypothetical protein